MGLRIVIFTVLLFAVTTSSAKNLHDLPTNQKVYHAAARTGYPSLICAIAKVESNYRAYATSSKGALGVTQIRPSVWRKELRTAGIIQHDDDLYDVDKNVQACSYVLMKLKKQHKNDLKAVLSHYSGRAKNYYIKVMKEQKKFSSATFR